MLEINVKKQLGSLALSVNLQIPSNGVTALFGLSGSGKSSLINLVSGLSLPDQGYIQLNNRTLVDTARKINLPPEQRYLGYVFQDARLFPHYTVKGNLAYGMKKVSKAVYQEIIELLGIEPLLKRYPLTLSGGEKQRVAIGRALLTEPELLLMDEPLAALDLPRKQELLDYLDRLAKEINIPILYVSHSLEELLRLAQRVILIQQGKVLAFDDLETIWQSPHFLPWKGVQQQSAVFSLPIEMHHPLYQMTALNFAGQPLWIHEMPQKNAGDLVRICIYSSDVSIILQPTKGSSIRNVLACQITEIEIQAQQVEVRLNADGLQFGASISRWALAELELQVGMWVYAQIKSVSVIA
ncbi:molybdenum ABC transporter ATP-binding protein ModC [Pasteurellaceae bacterium USgator11]|nr:molybdenum ABC transporter ATP-binding protein ModC [Pasteurellaceae bacterium USgator41]TNG95036.1 molybdenum ABC transporter ATP-binding protein ModC [Pasteurellaceae bacterium UScroc12]TNH01378.1 molybdenum ABC transporter ATP-binding protein ModC [Pasteurellaceae bacterium UScroc31]TNH02500.1 molybdenum ABC transporter ATP-binding protein ModC [Pasteurellaceae bacterium USgator11]